MFKNFRPIDAKHAYNLQHRHDQRDAVKYDSSDILSTHYISQCFQYNNPVVVKRVACIIAVLV